MIVWRFMNLIYMALTNLPLNSIHHILAELIIDIIIIYIEKIDSSLP